MECKYWDESAGAWSTEGVTSVLRDGVLYCETSHLTQFGGLISIPTSADELFAELLTAVQFNTFTLDEIADLLANFSFGENPTIMTVILTLLFADILSIFWLGWYRGYRARRRRERDGEMFEIEQMVKQVRDIEVKLKDVQDSELRQAQRAAELAAKWSKDCLSTARTTIAMRVSQRQIAWRIAKQAFTNGSLSGRSRQPTASLSEGPSRRPDFLARAIDVSRRGSAVITRRIPLSLPRIAPEPLGDGSRQGQRRLRLFGRSIAPSPAVAAEGSRTGAVGSRPSGRSSNMAWGSPGGQRSGLTQDESIGAPRRIVSTPPPSPPATASSDVRAQPDLLAGPTPPPSPPIAPREPDDLPTGDAPPETVPADLPTEDDAPPETQSTRFDVRALSQRVRQISVRDMGRQASQLRRQASQLTLRDVTKAASKNSKRAGSNFCSFCKRLIDTARNEHTVINLLAPPDDEEALTPPQMVQVFWNTLATELFVCCFQYQVPDEEPTAPPECGRGRPVCDEDGKSAGGEAFVGVSTFTIAPVTAMTQGVIASSIALFVIAICAYVFRLGNSRVAKPWTLGNRIRGCVRSCRRRLSGQPAPGADAPDDEVPVATPVVPMVEEHELTQIGWMVLVFGCLVCPGFNLLALCFCRKTKLVPAPPEVAAELAASAVDVGADPPANRTGAERQASETSGLAYVRMPRIEPQAMERDAVDRTLLESVVEAEASESSSLTFVRIPQHIQPKAAAQDAVANSAPAAPTPPPSPPSQRLSFGKRPSTPSGAGGAGGWSQVKCTTGMARVRQQLAVWAKQRSAKEEGNAVLNQRKVRQLVLTAQLAQKRQEFNFRREHVFRCRLALAWMFNALIFLLALFTSFIYGLKFKESATNNMVLTWAIAYGVTFAIVEPVQVIFLVCTPCLFSEDHRCGRCMLQCRWIYNVRRCLLQHAAPTLLQRFQPLPFRLSHATQLSLHLSYALPRVAGDLCAIRALMALLGVPVGLCSSVCNCCGVAA